MSSLFASLYVGVLLSLAVYGALWICIGELMLLWLRIFVTSIIGVGVVSMVLFSFLRRSV